MSKSPLVKTVAAFALLASVSGNAIAAVDPAKFADLLKAKLAASNMTLDVGSSELSGSSVILKDVKVTFAGAKEALDLGSTTFENVSEQGDGYLVGKWAIQPFDKTEADTSTSFKGGALNNIQLLPSKPDDPMSAFLIYESADFGGFEIIEAGTRVFSVGQGKATMSPYKANEKMNFDVVLNDVYGNFTSAKDVQVKKVMGDLGYPEISGKFTMKGNWNPADGRMQLPEFALDLANVGKLNIAMDISGYTAQFAKQMQDMAKNAASQDSSAQGMAIMGLMGQLTFNSMSIRFDDASLTGKLIDYAAKQSNQPREAIVAQAKGMAPMAVMALQDATLMQKVSEAVNAYIDSPKNFEIKAAPAAPVSFAVLMASGMGAPAQLAQQLGLTVAANQ